MEDIMIASWVRYDFNCIVMTPIIGVHKSSKLFQEGSDPQLLAFMSSKLFQEGSDRGFLFQNIRVHFAIT